MTRFGRVTISILAILAVIVVAVVLSYWDFFLRTSATVTVNGRQVEATVFRSAGGRVILRRPANSLLVYVPKHADVEADMVDCDPYNFHQFGPVATLVSGDICMGSLKAESPVPLNLSVGRDSLAFNDMYAQTLQRIEIRW
jgi:hypothetical protein